MGERVLAQGPGFDRADLDACVRCGICLPACPTYAVLGQEMDSPRGRIHLMRAVADGRHPMSPGVVKHLDRCLGCLGCETACPSGVPYGRLLDAARRHIHATGLRAPGDGPRRAVQGMLLDVFPDPARAGRALRALRLAHRTGLRAVARASGALRPFRRLRAMDALVPGAPPAPRPLASRWPGRGASRGTAGLLLGCVQRSLFGDVNEATARVLQAAGYDVHVPQDQGCCGALDEHAGRRDDAARRARALIDRFADVDVVVVNASGCGAAMKHYGDWLGDEAAHAFAAKVRDVHEVLSDATIPLGRLDATVTVHDACHLAHAQRLRDAPRAVLARIPGLRIVEMAESDLCCGSAGVYNILEPDVADALGRRKAGHARATGTSYVASANPGCTLQIARWLRGDARVVHPVQLVAMALDAGATRDPSGPAPAHTLP